MADSLPVLGWTEATAHTPFSPRTEQSAVVFNNAIWAIGGADPDSQFYNDVWYSSDGSTWTEATANAAFGPRAGQRSVVFDNKIWVIGGRDGNTMKPLNDVWYSSDGVTWTEATANAPFAPRWDFGIAVYNGSIWVIGGTEDGIVHNDVWYSSDGVTWTEATAQAAFSPRMNLDAVEFNNTLWVTGGFDWTRDYSDIWTSQDGSSWQEVVMDAPFQDRRYHGFESGSEGLFVIGGLRDYVNSPYYDDTWYSSDGKSWTRVTDNATFLADQGITTALFNDRLYIIGGDSGNSVWYSQELGALFPAGISTLGLPGTSSANGSQMNVTKSVSPWSLKQGSNANVTIILANTGLQPVTDVEILDGTPAGLPVVGGQTQANVQNLGPNETYSLTYTIQASEPGTYLLNATTVMYADATGNYHVISSNTPGIVVLAPLIPPSPNGVSGDTARYAVFGGVIILIIVAAFLMGRRS